MSHVHNDETQGFGDDAIVASPGFSGRRTVLLILIFAVALAGFRLAFVDGLLRPVVVDGPSMAPTFKSDHLHMRCRECQFIWPVDIQQSVSTNAIWCPNCGYHQAKADVSRLLPAERLLVDRWPLLWREPQRWEAVALQLQNPEGKQSETFQAMKRVVGLPGEEVSLRDGDLFINGERPSRKLSQWRTTTTVVHDDQFRVRDEQGKPKCRWRSDDPQWESLSDGYRFLPDELAHSTKSISPPAVLIYHHERQRRGDHVSYCLPLDDDPFNVDNRELQTVSDLALSTWTTVQPGATIEFALFDGQKWCRAFWSAESHEWTLFYGSQVLGNVHYHWYAKIPIHVELIRVDGQLWLAVNGRMIAKHALDNNASDPNGPAEWLAKIDTAQGHCAAIAASAAEVRISKVQILRDIHYLPPPDVARKAEPATWVLQPDEYFVLGDNTAVSVDSRQWQANSITRESIWGIIYPR